MTGLTQQFEMVVHFDGTTPDVSPSTHVEVTEATAFITLTLQSSVEGAAFPSNPIEWVDVDTGQPISQPANFAVFRESATTCSITDANNATVETKYRFVVLVQSGNQIFQSDPTIINQPPGGTPGT